MSGFFRIEDQVFPLLAGFPTVTVFGAWWDRAGVVVTRAGSAANSKPSTREKCAAIADDSRNSRTERRWPRCFEQGYRVDLTPAPLG